MATCRKCEELKAHRKFLNSEISRLKGNQTACRWIGIIGVVSLLGAVVLIV